MSGTASAVPQPVMVTADRAALAAGRYTGSVRIDAVIDGVTVSNTVDVTFNKEGHWLYVSSLGVAGMACSWADSAASALRSGCTARMARW